jgi:DNA-binding NtrC family response regulator
MIPDKTDEQLHAADAEALGRQIMDLALERTGAVNGALFLWDDEVDGLVIALHVVEGLTVTIPETVLRREGPQARPGIALWVFENNEPHLCSDTGQDPNYTRYLLDVGSIAAVPIRYQQRAIGVITVSSRRVGAFDPAHITALEELAASAATFVRRAALDRKSRARTGRPFLIKGLSHEWLEVERRIERAAPTNAPILIRGESGTGKDLVASAIHFNSRRADQPYVTVNCAAIPETLLESILFGHLKGAFTGASFTKIGEFEKANGGTLFLDEVGELPVMLQAKVLRAVEQGEIQPLGSNKPAERVDVRLICATNRDLAAMARDGRFRDDLYYRLGVMTMQLPPLRSYKDNLEVLAHVFLQQSAARHGKAAPRISPAAMELLARYEYPGNVRELKNAIEHAVIMAFDEIEPDDLPQPFRELGSGAPASSPARKKSKSRTLRELRETWLAPLEQQYLTQLLEECQGNVRKAAARAGVNPVTFYRLLRKRGLSLSRTISALDE